MANTTPINSSEDSFTLFEDFNPSTDNNTIQQSNLQYLYEPNDKTSHKNSSVASVASIEHHDFFTNASETSSEFSFYHKQQESPQSYKDGAMREGGIANLYSFAYIGLLANYAAVGIIYGSFPSMIYPFLKNYLNMASYQVTAAKSLVNLPWSFKTIIGIFSDSFPIFGYRRISYMILGWGLCGTMLLVLSIMQVVDPYYEPGSTETILNKAAPASGYKYIIIMMMASFGYLIADVAADGMTVEIAQREPIASRGHTQTTIYMVRTIFSILGKTLVAFSFNGEEYGGDFNWSLNFNVVMLILACCAALAIPFSYWCVLEEKAYYRIYFTDRCRTMWGIIQKRAIWQLLAFEFVYSFLANFSSASSYAVKREWANVKPFSESIADIMSLVAFGLSLYLGKRYFLNVGWRSTFVISTIIIVAIDATYTLLTIYNVIRNQWFWLLTPLLHSFPGGLRFLVATLPIVEVSELGYEASTYGLVTTVHNLAFPFSSAVFKQVDSYFSAYERHVKMDTQYTRNQVAMTYIIAFAFNLASLVAVFLLPRNRMHAQLLRKKGGSSRVAGFLALILTLFALVWAITTNLLSVFKETACYKIAGGSGCG